jgi:hypothetical protein
MASTFHFFDGEARWARVRSPNQFGNYSVDLIVDKETKKAIKATGMKGNAKDTPDTDEPFFTFRRKAELKKRNGEVVDMGPPEVKLKDGSDFEGLIGNGSKVTVKVEIYDYDSPEFGKGKGCRLVGIRVNELVEYNPENTEAPAASNSSSKEMPF